MGQRIWWQRTHVRLSLPQCLLRWLALRDPRPLSTVGKSETRQTHHQWGKTRLGSISKNWTDVNPWWDRVASAEGAGWCYCNATFNYLILTTATRGDSQGLEETECHSCLQEARYRELQAGQPHLNPWKGDWANIGNHFQRHKRHGDEKSPWTSAKSCLTNTCYEEMTRLLGSKGCDPRKDNWKAVISGV